MAKQANKFVTGFGILLSTFSTLLVLFLTTNLFCFSGDSEYDLPDRTLPITMEAIGTLQPEPSAPDTTKIMIKKEVPISEAERLKALTLGYRILIDKKKHDLTLFKDSLVVKKYKVATGKNPGDKKTDGDFRTPEGHFFIRCIVDAKDVLYDFNDGRGKIKGAFGQIFMALYTGSDVTKSGKTWTGIGIHGTSKVSSIGTNASHGCIRMRNADVIELYKLISNARKVPVDIM